MKVSKNIKIFVNYFLGPVLFLWLGWSIYRQISTQPDLQTSWMHIKKSFTTSGLYYLVMVMALLVVNIGIEAYKWVLAVRRVEQVSFWRGFKAVLSGISVSISTPNRVGEYIGRVLYMKEGNKIKAISLTIVASMSQLLVTIMMGWLALFFFKGQLVQAGILPAVWVNAVFYGTGIGFVILTLFYFRLSWLVKLIDKLPQIAKYTWMIEALEHLNATLLLRFLSLSVTRFLVFTLQYYLLFRLFSVNVNFFEAWMGISVMFLVMAVIPTIALFTDLSLKNELILKLIGLFSANHLGISLTSLSIWLINLILPAILGSIFILGLRNIIKNKDEEMSHENSSFPEE